MIFRILEGILLFQAIAASMADTFLQIILPLTSEKPQYDQI